MKNDTKNKQLKIRLTEKLFCALKDIAKARSLTVTEVIEVFIVAESAKRNAVENKKDEPKGKDSRGTKLTTSVIPDEWLEWALSERPELLYPAIVKIWESFHDYWVAQPGAKGRKADWFATWRNWVRKDAKFTKNGGGHAKPERFDAREHCYKQARRTYAEERGEGNSEN